MQVLVVDADRAVREMMGQALRDDGFGVVEAQDGASALEIGRRLEFDLVFCDEKVGQVGDHELLRILHEELQPNADIILMTGRASIESALEAVRLGARDYICKPFSVDDVSGLARSAMERRRIVRDATLAAEAVPQYAGLIGRSPVMIELFRTVSRVATTDLPVLISGESGTGKDVIARTIHANSPRATLPFVTVDCGVLTEALLEIELFGHVKGGLAGASSDRRGLFEEANGGTILFDEVTEISPSFQEKLLRLLQEQEVRRVGSNVPFKFNVRVLATTSRDPEALVSQGMFRDDLLYRLNVISLRMPPLRERSGDIDLLLQEFVGRYRRSGASTPRIAPEALDRLRAYTWPGNVRELRHTIQRLAATNASGTIRSADLPDRIRNTAGDLDELLHEMPGQDVVGPSWTSIEAGSRAGTPEGTPVRRPEGSSLTEGDRAWLPLEEIERRYLVRVLYHTRGNKKRSAEILGVDRKTLSRMVERYAINVARIKRDVRGLR